MGHIFDFWSCSLIWRYLIIWRSIFGHDMFSRPTENSTKKCVKPYWWHFDDIKSLIWDETELKGTICKWRAADFPYFVCGAQSTRVQWRRLRARFGLVHYGAWVAHCTPAPEKTVERGTVAQMWCGWNKNFVHSTRESRLTWIFIIKKFMYNSLVQQMHQAWQIMLKKSFVQWLP